jgi:hypothetical protein
MTNVQLNEPSIKSNDAQWIQWHKDLKGVFGKKTANSLFIAFWKKRQSSAANTTSLRTYAKGQGFKIEGDSVISGVIDSSYDFIDGIGDMLKIGKYATIGVIGILVIGLGMTIFNIAKEPIKAISAAGKVAKPI